MKSITEKQYSLINNIELELGITFRGKTSHDAFHWIKNHLTLMEGNSITEKQKIFISYIEETFNIKFEGFTKFEAKEWLSKYAPLYKKRNAKDIASYLFNNGYTIDDISYDSDGRLIIPKPREDYYVEKPVEVSHLGQINVVEYSESMGMGHNFGIMKRIEEFNDSCPSVKDIDNHINYLTVAFKSVM